jgi:hypothetical protein
VKRYLRRRNLLLGPVFIGASIIGFGTKVSAAENSDPTAACQKLASITSFPVSPIQITLAKLIRGQHFRQRNLPPGALPGAGHHQQANGCRRPALWRPL